MIDFLNNPKENMEPKLALEAGLIVQSNNMIMAKAGAIPVIPDMIINGSDLEQEDLKRIGINFMRSGCPTIQVLFIAQDYDDEGKNAIQSVVEQWTEFLDLLKMNYEKFEIHHIKGKPTKSHHSPATMSMLITRHVKPPEFIEL